MTRPLSWLLVVLLLGAFGAVTVHLLRARAAAGKGMPAFSIYSAERDGLLESANLLRKLGWEPIAVTRPIRNTTHRGLLILAEPEGVALLPGDTPDLPETEVRSLLAWVEQGNTLLLAGRQMTALHRALDITVTADTATPNTVRTPQLGEAGGYTDGLEQLAVEGRHVVRAPGSLPLWWLDEQAGALLLRHGQGRVLIVADPSPLTLRGLLRADNAVFLYNVVALHARDGRVYFDEYHHGLRSTEGFWGYLHHHDQQRALLPILLVVLAAVWAAAVRLGPAVPTPRDVRTDAVDYASSIARIYQRSGARRLLARALVRDFLEALTRHLRLRRSALPAEVLAAWRRQHPAASADRLQTLLRGVMELRKGGASERQLLTWAQALDRFQAEVLRAR